MLKRIISGSFAAMLFFTPLVLWPKTFEVFEFNKMMLVYFFAGLIALLWSTRCLLEKRLIFKRTPLDLPIFLFLFSQILSTIFSIDPHTSLWGYYSRFHGGLASTITYILLFYALVSNLTAKDISLLIYSIVSSTILVVLYAIAEHFGIDKKLWVQDVQSRVFSTLGQPNWLSAYLIAVFPMIIYPALYGRFMNRPYQKIFYFLFSACILLAIWYTKSQSGLATTAIILVLIIGHQIYLRSKPALLLLIPLIFLIVYSQRSTINRIIHLYQLPINEAVRQESEVRFGGSDSMLIRRVVWTGAVDLFRRRPILGTGVETFAYSYYWTRPSAHNLLSEWDFLYNKAHNEFLNLLATTGIVGFLSYLFFIISTLWLLLKTKNYPLFTGYVSILITNFFGFSVVPVALLFFLFPALSIISTSTLSSPAKEKNRAIGGKMGFDSPSISQTTLVTLSFVVFMAWTIILARHWTADVKYNRGKALLEAGFVGNALPLLEKSVELFPAEPTFKSTLAQAYAQAAYAVGQQYAQLTPEQKTSQNLTYQTQIKQFIQKAVQTMDETIKTNRYHLNFYRTKAQVELILSSFDPNFTQTALNTLLSANELAPTDAKILYNIGLINLELNQTDKARLAFQKTLELKPNYDQATFQLDNLQK